MHIFFLIIVSVIASTAQVVLKTAARAWSASGTLYDLKVIGLFSVSFGISCFGQLVWFYVLKSVPLSSSYLFLALVFVFVPVAGMIFFGERLTMVHVASMALIIAGVALQGYASQS